MPARSSRDSLDTYLSRISRHHLLERDEELAIATRYVETRDPKLAERLIAAHLRLVVKLARDIRSGSTDMDDLIQQGNLGLMHAVERFDPQRGVKLSTYAAWWIRAYMLAYVRDTWRLVKVGGTREQRKLFFGLRKAQAALSLDGEPVGSAEVAARMDVGERTVEDMDRRLREPELSLDELMGDGDGGFGSTRGDRLRAPEDERPDEQVAGAELRARVEANVADFAAHLEGREAQLFRERWRETTPGTLSAFGRRHGITRERARQIEAKLLLRLRRRLEQDLGLEEADAA